MTIDPRYPRSAALSARAGRLMPGGVSSSLRVVEPNRVFVRAKGAYVWDADGNRYVDYHAAFGPNLLGHTDERVNGRAFAAAAQLDVTGLGATELEIALAEKLVEHVPSAEKVLFCNSGSEATYHALRVARAFTGRRRIVKFQGCYHGWHDSVAANVISAPDRLGTIDPISAGVMPQALESLIVLPFNDPDSLDEVMRREGHTVAAVIVEPIIHTIGCVLPSPEFLEVLRRTTREAGSLLVFDEVVTGFRHHLGGYQAICGITPDLSTFAKAMANGYPIGAVVGRADVMDRFNTRPEGDVLFGGTFNGNPVSVAAALATIEILEADDRAVHRRLFDLGTRMRDGLVEITDRLGLPARPTSFGSVFVCYFTDREVRSFDDALTNDATLYVSFHRRMGERGFLMIPMNLKRNCFSAAHSEEDLARTLQAAEDVLGELARERARSGRIAPARA